MNEWGALLRTPRDPSIARLSCTSCGGQTCLSGGGDESAVLRCWHRLQAGGWMHAPGFAGDRSWRRCMAAPPQRLHDAVEKCFDFHGSHVIVKATWETGVGEREREDRPAVLEIDQESDAAERATTTTPHTPMHHRPRCAPCNLKQALSFIPAYPSGEGSPFPRTPLAPSTRSRPPDGPGCPTARAGPRRCPAADAPVPAAPRP